MIGGLMHITVTQLNNLLAAAKREGYDEGRADMKIDAQFSDTNTGYAGPREAKTAYQEYVKTEDVKSETEPESEYVDEEYFSIYGDGYDDGYAEAIADVKESLTF
jgi:hypothetical protein